MLYFLAIFLFCCVESLSAQIINVRVSGAGVSDAEEVSIAVNPTDPRYLQVGANVDYLFSSSDSGRSWSTTNMSSPYGEAGDPALLYTWNGSLLYEHLSNEQNGGWLHRMVIERSTDNGQSFDVQGFTGVSGSSQQDKGWLAQAGNAGTTGAPLGTAWTRFDHYGSRVTSDSSHIFFATSSDDGRSWSDALRIDDTGGDCIDSSNTVEGAVTAYGANGEVFVVWSGHDVLTLDRSLDGGKTFGKDQVIADQPHGWDLEVSGIYRANGLPMLACDHSPGKYRGRLYVLWSDKRRGVVDVYMIHSSDNGDHWSAPLRVNTDLQLNQHFFPSMTIDPVTGIVYVVFYDRRSSTTNATDVYLARSDDGGNSFIDFRIDENSFTPGGGFIGDYINVAAFDRHVYPVWTRADGNRLSVWTALITDTAKTLGVSQSRGVDRSDSLWVTSEGMLAFQLGRSSQVDLAVYDELGRRLHTITDASYGIGEFHVPLPRSLATGTYFVKANIRDETGALRMLTLRWQR